MSALLDKVLRQSSRVIRENDDLRKALKKVLASHTESACKLVARRALGMIPPEHYRAPHYPKPPM